MKFKKNLVSKSLKLLMLAALISAPVSQAKADIIIPTSIPSIIAQQTPINSNMNQAQSLLQTFLLYHPDFQLNHPQIYNAVMNNPSTAYSYINNYNPSDWENYYQEWVRNNPERAEYFRTNPQAYVNWRNSEYGDNWKNFGQFLKYHPEYAPGNQWKKSKGKKHTDRGRHLGHIRKFYQNQ